MAATNTHNLSGVCRQPQFTSIAPAIYRVPRSLLEISMPEKDVPPLSLPPHELNCEHATAYDSPRNASVRRIQPPTPPPASSKHRRRPAQFRQKDLQRALKAAQDAGLEVKMVELDPSGKVSISTADPRKSATEQGGIIET